MNLFRCRRCLYPCTKPDLRFNSEGICSACTAYDARASIDWAAREQEFLKLCRNNAGLSHDVVVAVSGGKDSTWQVLKCLELGIRPLAVCATTDHLSEIGRKNLDNIAELCDLVEITPHKPTRRAMSAFALREVGDISWCEHHLIWSAPAREAVNRGIPLVLYGECPQNEYGAGPAGSELTTELTPEWTHEFGGLLGLRLSDMQEMLDIPERHLELYRQPRGDLFRAIFMGAYFPWDGRDNARIAEQHGWHGSEWPVEGSGYHYENLDNYQTGIHDALRFAKFGYGRCCDISSNLIRRGQLSREDGADRCLLYDGKFPASYLGKPLKEILDPLGIGQPEFLSIRDRFTNREVVKWASRPESFQHYFGMTTDASKADSSTTADASAA